MLLHIDDVTEEWNSDLEKLDIDESNNIPYALWILDNPASIKNYNMSSMVHGMSLEECNNLIDLEESDIFFTQNYGHTYFKKINKRSSQITYVFLPPKINPEL